MNEIVYCRILVTKPPLCQHLSGSKVKIKIRIIIKMEENPAFSLVKFAMIIYREKLSIATKLRDRKKGIQFFKCGFVFISGGGYVHLLFLKFINSIVPLCFVNSVFFI